MNIFKTVVNFVLSIYETSIELEKAISNLDISLFTQCLDQVCDLCDNNSQLLTIRLAVALCKASSLTALSEESKDLPALFVRYLLYSHFLILSFIVIIIDILNQFKLLLSLYTEPQGT